MKDTIVYALVANDEAFLTDMLYTSAHKTCDTFHRNGATEVSVVECVMIEKSHYELVCKVLEKVKHVLTDAVDKGNSKEVK